MYEVITIRTEYEGWWLFDDLWDYVTELNRFSTLEETEIYYNEQLNKLRKNLKMSLLESIIFMHFIITVN